MSSSHDQSRSNNFGLTEDEFVSLRSALMAGDEALFEKIFVSQASSCIKFLRNKFGLSYEDSYDATMETLIQFRRNLISDKLTYGNLKYIFNRMAKFFVIKKIERRKEFSSDELEIFELQSAEEKYESDQLQKIKSVWSQLDDEEKKILHLHFTLNARLKDIAQNLGINESAARKRKQRILNKIKRQFQNERNG